MQLTLPVREHRGPLLAAAAATAVLAIGLTAFAEARGGMAQTPQLQAAAVTSAIPVHAPILPPQAAPAEQPAANPDQPLRSGMSATVTVAVQD